MKSTFILLSLIFCGFTLQAQTSCNVNFSIGNDSTLLCGQSYTLQANQGLDNYSWSTGSSQSSITVSTSGTYSCFATSLGPDLVVNGDFSAGNTGFQTDYVLGTGGTWGLLSLEGRYVVMNNASAAHTNFANCFDHTVGNATGNMLIVNGSSIPGTTVWEQTITVAPNTNYLFEMWATSVVSQNPGIFIYTINGVQIGSLMNLPTTTCQWVSFNETWNSGTNTQAVIAIESLNTQISGNDFAIDDISFRPVCTYTDQVTVVIPPNPVIQTSPTQTICEGDDVDLTASSSTPNMTYTWTPGGTGATINVSPTQQTTYSVVGEDANGCISSAQTVVVNVNPLPVLTFQGDSVICEGTAGMVTVSSSIPQTGFLWSNNNITIPTITVAPSATTIYEVTATSPSGCVATAEFEMTVIEKLAIEINGNTVFCEGDQNSLQAISNLPGTDFLWLPRNEAGPVLNTTINDLGWVYLEGSHPICGVEKDSIQLVLGEKPVISLPDSLNICLGDEVNVVAVSSLPNSQFTWVPGNLSGANQLLSPPVSSYFYVQANVGGCKSDLDSVFISVNPNCDIEMPNVFTPNADGANDFFKLINYEGIQQLECVIVNRWGNVVREFDAPDFKWNGTDKNGNKITDGTYFYMIKAKTISGEEVNKSGFVQLITK